MISKLTLTRRSWPRNVSPAAAGCNYQWDIAGVTVTRMSFGNGANVARDPSLREAISIPTKGDRRLSYAA